MKRNLIVLLAVAALGLVILIPNLHIFLPDAANQAAASTPVPLPADFPKDFPIYPGALYQGADEAVADVGTQSYNRGWFEIRTPAQTVIDWYTAHLAGAGYAPVATRDQPGTKHFSFAPAKPVLALEIFPETNKPTTFSVDFATAKK